MLNEKETTQNTPIEPSNNDLASDALDAWDFTERSHKDTQPTDITNLETDPLKIDRLLDESRTVIYARRGDTTIKFVVRKLTATELVVYLENLFGISSYLEEQSELSDRERFKVIIDKVTEDLDNASPVTLYDQILLATEAAIEEPEGITAQMLHNWPEALVNKLTSRATGGAFGDTAQIRFLKEIDKSGRLLSRDNTGQDSDEVSDPSDGNSEEV